MDGPVAVLVPVLRRPHRVAPLLDSFHRATSAPHRLVFVAEENDHAERRAIEAVGADHVLVGRPQRSWACKINIGIRSTTEPVLFAGADDLEFHPGWLEAALRRLAPPVEVVGTNDLLNPRVMSGQHATHFLFTRRYVETQGTIDGPGDMLHEGYRHDYADDEAIQTAISRGAFAHAHDSVVEHLHPWAGKAPDDQVYAIGRRWRIEGRRLYRRREKLWGPGAVGG